MNINLNPEGFLFPYVRFFNAAPGIGNFDFYHGNTLVAAGIPFGAFSSYIKIPNGQQIFKLTKSGNKNDVVAQMAINFGVGEVFTVCAIKNGNDVSFFGINEPTEKSNLQYGHIRICNLAKECDGAEVFAGEERILGDVRYLDVSRYMETLPGKYDFKIRKTSAEKAYLSCPSQLIKQGKYNTLFITDISPETGGPLGIFTIDAASYSGFYL